MRPHQRFTVDIFLQKAFTHHQAEIAPCAPPRGIRRLVDDVAQIIEATRRSGLAIGQPLFARLPTFPRLGGEAQNFDLDAQRSSVRARMSAQVAATVIGRPRIEPELSMTSETTVSRNLVSRSFLKESGCMGSMMSLTRRAGSR